MNRIRSFARIAVVMSIVAAVAVPCFAARGKADFTRFVAIGDSYGAGFEAGSLNERHQIFSWPAIIAQAAGLTLCPTTALATDNCFAQGLIAFPGLPGGETVYNGVGLVTIPGSGGPRMAGFARPYNNLAVPGYTVGATLALTGAEPTSGLGQVILRGLGTEVDQAIALKPTFIAIWIGGNDFLGAVSQGSPNTLTPLASFTAQYGAMLDKLIAGAPGAGMIVGTLPNNFLAVPLTRQQPARDPRRWQSHSPLHGPRRRNVWPPARRLGRAAQRADRSGPGFRSPTYPQDHPPVQRATPCGRAASGQGLDLAH